MYEIFGARKTLVFLAHWFKVVYDSKNDKKTQLKKQNNVVIK